jgi:hypothetical protein
LTAELEDSFRTATADSILGGIATHILERSTLWRLAIEELIGFTCCKAFRRWDVSASWVKWKICIYAVDGLACKIW